MVYLNFEANKSLIVSELCVQRDNDLNTCQGSCILKEKLGLQSDEEENNSEEFILEAQDVVFLSTIQNLLLTWFTIPCKPLSCYSRLPLKGELSKTWRPPSLKA